MNDKTKLILKISKLDISDEDKMQLIDALSKESISKESINCSDTDTHIEVGKCYLIRTVTLYHTGRVKSIKGNEVLLEHAAWIAETKRFHDSLKNNEFKEVEPFVKDVIVYRTAFIDVTEIDGPHVRQLPEKI